MRAPLSSFSKFVTLIIQCKDLGNLSIDFLMGQLKSWCDENMTQYGMILHNKDVLEDGTPKNNHIHLCGSLNGRSRLSTTMNAVADFLKISVFAITIEKMEDFSASLQYLIHANNPDKHQYDIDEILTNIPKKELSVYLDYQGHSTFGLQSLIASVKKAHTRVELMEDIGLGQYHFYRREIDDIAWESGKDWFRERR